MLQFLAQGGDGSTTTTVPDDVDPIGDLATTISEGCKPGDSWVCERVFDATGNKALAGAAEWFVAKPLTALLIFAVAFVVNRILRKLVGRWAKRMVDPTATFRRRAPNILQSTREMNLRTEARAKTITSVAKSLTSVAVYTTAVFTALSLFNINLGPLLAGAGIAGVALGFGAQSIVRDFLSGMFMILEDQFGVGDVIEVGGVTGTQNSVTGTVERITLRSTRLRDVSGTVWHVPNGEIRRIGNKSQEWARALLDIDVAADTDLRAAQDVIQRVADDMAEDDEWRSEILEPPEVWGVEAIGPDSASIRLVVKVSPASQWRVMRELRLRLKDAFEAEGIPVPLGQRTMLLQADDGAVVSPPQTPPNTSKG